LTLTLSSLRGSFDNTDNIQEPQNVVAQDATYICDRPGDVEFCVDATDGACVKTLCTNVTCTVTARPIWMTSSVRQLTFLGLEPWTF
jgi:hypothetical protein